ncbi:integral membrane protein [Rutstroemia sp. NJR-2017a BVV2]|nr:integral membrane protein [Rutstroemia sp. NJR-2017a BVV2]
MNETQAFITDTDKSPLIEVFVWVPLALSCLGVCARFITKLSISKALQLQDHLVSISLLFAIAQSIAVAVQCANGYGQQISTLSDRKEKRVLEAGYAADLLFIASLCFVKLSIVSFIDDLTPVARQRLASRSIGVVVALWTISSLFSSAFQCSLPRPWDSINGSCFDRIKFENYYAAMNIITDAGLILMIAFIATRIQTSRLRRFTIIAVFGTRMLVVAAVGVQIFFLNKPVLDPTFDPWAEAISTQVVLCLSILTACFPYLKPFLLSLESGLMRVDDLRRRGQTDGEIYNHYNIDESNGSGTKRSKVKKMLLDTISAQSRSQSNQYRLSNVTPVNIHDQSVATAVVVEAQAGPWDGQSRDSQTSQSRIIKETRSWNVDVVDTGLESNAQSTK